MPQTRMKLNFFDDYWVDFRPGTTRRWFHPEYVSAPVDNMGFSSVFYDPQVGKYRLYHDAMCDPENERKRGLKLLESEDMIHFTRVYADNGSDVIFDGDGGLHGVSVMLDPRDPDPKRRYKLVGMTQYDGTARDHTVNLAFSEDGIHWENHPEMIVHAHKSDTLNKLFYNPCAEEYVLLHRSAYVDRRISVKTSKDLIHWSQSRILLQPDGNSNNDHLQTQHYAMTADWFDGMFYGLLWRYYTDLFGDDYTKMFGVLESELTYSYDGVTFLSTPLSPIIERPMAPNPGWAGLVPEDMCVSADGKYFYILCGGYSFPHGTLASNQAFRQRLQARGLHNAMPLYKIRADGFCGLESVCPGGKVITKPLELLDDDLTFNIRAECGSVRFGIMDRNGNYLEGFSLDDCIGYEFVDDVQIKPRWKKKTLADALDQRVRLVVELNGAILHSISATARPYIVMPQKSFADPIALFEE